MEKVFETDKLVLKVLDETYAAQVLDYQVRNRAFLEEWELKRPDEFYTMEAHTAMLRNEHKDFEEKRSLRLWIFKKDEIEKDKVIGLIGFNNIVWGAFLSCFLGYKLDKDEINKGYVTEALKKGIEVMFSGYGLHRIEANIMPKNARSLRVVEKLGFYNEGLAKKYLRINGRWEDHIHMVLLNEKLE